MRFDVLARKFREEAAQTGATIQVCLFTNIPVQPTPGLEAWIRAMLQNGLHVFAKRKSSPDSDIDPDMLAHLAARRWDRAVVVSHDARCFARPLAEMAARGTEVLAVGMTEFAGCLPATDGITFIDVDDIDDLCPKWPTRVRLHNVPEHGCWFHPAEVA
jgi:uncharacterized protein